MKSERFPEETVHPFELLEMSLWEISINHYRRQLPPHDFSSLRVLSQLPQRMKQRRSRGRRRGVADLDVVYDELLDGRRSLGVPGQQKVRKRQILVGLWYQELALVVRLSKRLHLPVQLGLQQLLHVPVVPERRQKEQGPQQRPQNVWRGVAKRDCEIDPKGRVHDGCDPALVGSKLPAHKGASIDLGNDLQGRHQKIKALLLGAVPDDCIKGHLGVLLTIGHASGQGAGELGSDGLDEFVRLTANQAPLARVADMLEVHDRSSLLGNALQLLPAARRVNHKLVSFVDAHESLIWILRGRKRISIFFFSFRLLDALLDPSYQSFALCDDVVEMVIIGFDNGKAMIWILFLTTPNDTRYNVSK